MLNEYFVAMSMLNCTKSLAQQYLTIADNK